MHMYIYYIHIYRESDGRHGGAHGWVRAAEAQIAARNNNIIIIIITIINNNDDNNNDNNNNNNVRILYKSAYE